MFVDMLVSPVQTTGDQRSHKNSAINSSQQALVSYLFPNEHRLPAVYVSETRLTPVKAAGPLAACVGSITARCQPVTSWEWSWGLSVGNV